MGEDPLRAAFLLMKKEKCGYFFEKERFYKLLSFSLCVYVPVSGAGRWMQEYAASRGLAVLRARMEGTRKKCRRGESLPSGGASIYGEVKDPPDLKDPGVFD